MTTTPEPEQEPAHEEAVSRLSSHHLRFRFSSTIGRPYGKTDRLTVAERARLRR